MGFRETILEKACAAATTIVTSVMDFAAGPPLVPTPKLVQMEGLEDEEVYEPCTLLVNGSQFIHAGCAGILGSYFVGSLYNPAHIEALTSLRRAAFVVMPVTGAWCIYSLHKQGNRLRIQDVAEKSTWELSMRMFHIFLYVPTLALEYKWAGTYDHTTLRIACALVTASFVSGKYLVIKHGQYYGSVARALSGRLFNANRQRKAAEGKLVE